MSGGVASAITRLAEAVEAHNKRERTAELESELRAIREEHKVNTAMRRGLFIHMVRNGGWLTKVPPEFWAQESAGVYAISCVCGQTPKVTGWLEITRCDCGRAFLFDGDDIRVDKPPNDRSPADLATPAET